MSNEQIEARLDERAEVRVKMRHPAGPEAQRHNGGIGTLRPTTARGKPH
jgi:hypothetical protein